jgi:hypothetical protein
MQTVNKLGDRGRMPSPNFRKHLRRRRSLDMLNDQCVKSHDNNTLIGKLAVNYMPVHLSK